MLLQASELTAGKGSKPTVVAGAISNRAREGGCPNITGGWVTARWIRTHSWVDAGPAGVSRRLHTHLTLPPSPTTLMLWRTLQHLPGPPPPPAGIGPEAVCNALMAVCHARLYLEVRASDCRRLQPWRKQQRLVCCFFAPPLHCGGAWDAGLKRLAAPSQLLAPSRPAPRPCLQQDHLDVRVIPSFQEVEKEDRTGDKHTMTAVKLQVVVEKV